MPPTSSLFRRRRKPAYSPDPAVVADASVVITSRRAPDVKEGPTDGKAATEKPVALEHEHLHRNRALAVTVVASILVALASVLFVQRHQIFGTSNLDLISKRMALFDELSFFQWRGKEQEERIVGADADTTSSTSSSSPTSSSTSSSPSTAGDEQELAAEARGAAESVAATSLGPSGFVSEEEWERALTLAAAERDYDDGGGGGSSSSSEPASALAALEASIRARAGAAARGALLADAASLPWQGVPRQAVVETLRRCPRRVEEEPEFFEGGGGSSGEAEGEEEEQEEKSPSSPPSATKCPLASSLPRSYPGETTAGAFSALGYETLPLLQSLMAANGFNRRHYASAAAMFFSRTPDHVNALPRRVTAAAVVAGGGEAPEAAAAAEDSASSSAVVKVAPLVARFAGTPKLRKAIAGVISVHQRSAEKKGGGTGGAASARAAAGAAAAVLERVVVLGERLPEAVRSASKLEDALSGLARSYLQEVLDAFEKEEKEAALSELLLRNAGKGDGGEQGVLLSSSSSSAPSSEEENDSDAGPWDTAQASLKGALAAALLHPDDFAAAARRSMLAGGDATARAHLVGAFLGATTATTTSFSPSSSPSSPPSARKPPPADWRPRVEKAVQADAMIHLILHQRGERVPVAMPGEQVPGAEQ